MIDWVQKSSGVIPNLLCTEFQTAILPHLIYPLVVMMVASFSFFSSAKIYSNSAHRLSSLLGLVIVKTHSQRQLLPQRASIHHAIPSVCHQKQTGFTTIYSQASNLHFSSFFISIALYLCVLQNFPPYLPQQVSACIYYN